MLIPVQVTTYVLVVKIDNKEKSGTLINDIATGISS